MKFLKKFEDIQWSPFRAYGQLVLRISEPIVMASAAGWYVGKICEDAELDGLIEPYTRMTDYVGTPEEAEQLLKS